MVMVDGALGHVDKRAASAISSIRDEEVVVKAKDEVLRVSVDNRQGDANPIYDRKKKRTHSK